MGTLYVLATPIGNLGDISPRALSTLKQVSLIAAEDTRHTGKLLAHFGIRTPVLSYHSFNERARRDQLLAALADGDVALVSDAGTPGIADPGQDLVAAALEAGFAVSPVPGPSSLTAAVSVSGLVHGPFLTLGFLPRKGKERTSILAKSALSGYPVVIFEAPSRVAGTLADLHKAFGDRRVVVARELSKLHEEISSGNLNELAGDSRFANPKGEFVLVVAGNNETSNPVNEVDIEAVLRELLAAGLKPSEAAREAAALTGQSRSDLYSLAIRFARTKGTGE